MKMIVFVALLAAAGCGSKKSGPDCAASIGKAIENFTPKVKSGATDPQIQESKLGRLEKVKVAFIERCVADKWASEAVACFNTVANLTVMKVCQDKLTSEQRTRLNADLHEIEKDMMGGRPPGDMAGPPGSGASGDPGGSAPAPAGSAADPAGAAALPAAAGSAAPAPAAGSSAK